MLDKSFLKDIISDIEEIKQNKQIKTKTMILKLDVLSKKISDYLEKSEPIPPKKLNDPKFDELSMKLSPRNMSYFTPRVGIN